MRHIVKLKESDFHRLVRSIIMEDGLGGATSCAGVYDTAMSDGTYENGDAQRKQVTDVPLGGVIRRPPVVGEPKGKKKDTLGNDALKRKNGVGGSISVNQVESAERGEINEVNWKGLALGGMMAFSPIQGNAQTQDYNPSRQARNSVEALTKQYNKTYSIKELVQMFPQAYVDRNANPDVWIENARQGKYTPSVKDNNDGRYKNMMVAYIAAKSGQNPWDALVKRYCPDQIGKTYKIGDF